MAVGVGIALAIRNGGVPDSPTEISNANLSVDRRGSQGEGRPGNPDTLRPVKTFTVKEKTNGIDVVLPATIEASREAILSFDIPGKLISLNVEASDRVAQGDVIARIDAQDLENSVAEAKANLARANSDYQRALRLAEREAIAVSQVEARKASRDIAQASFATAKKRLEDATLRAPFDGVIADVSVEQFQTVGANQAIVILQTSGVAATANLPADLVIFRPQYEPSDPVVQLDALPDTEFQGEFLEASSVADEATQTYKVSFLFTPSEGLLVLPGMTATVRTRLLFRDDTARIAPKGVEVPVASIISVGDGQFVWLYDPDTMRLKRQDVTVAEGVGSFVSVTKGLAEGDLIVAAGGATLGDGMAVRPWNGK